MIRPIHPFPARMAPDLAIAGLKEISRQSVVLDPMAGSGMVLRHASELGHHAIGFDVDPLAVLMAKVWTTPVEDAAVEQLASRVLNSTKTLSHTVELPWIDEDEETKQFIEYWFAEPQITDLRHLAFVLSRLDQSRLCAEKRAAANVLRVALSKIIITKNSGASLARDVSHSRPHKVAEASSFEVITAFERSVEKIRRLLSNTPPMGNVEMKLGDARHLGSIENNEVDIVLTSPPYLNAIDYMRGHRLSLVWLGHRLSELRSIRSNSVGAERGPDQQYQPHLFNSIQERMGSINKLPRRHSSMVARYAEDIYHIMSEVARVLKPKGKAILVVGNSCLRGVFIRNSNGIVRAASMVGLKLAHEVERELPTQSRYLPMPASTDKPLGKRMRTETVLTFVPA